MRLNTKEKKIYEIKFIHIYKYMYSENEYIYSAMLLKDKPNAG